jgi:hypothetical protein
MSLVGKFVFISSGHYYKYGEIAEATDQHNEFFLVKIFSAGHKSDTMSLYNITQMIQVEGPQEMSDDDDGSDFGVYWVFFNTEEELMRYVKKVEAPSKKKKTEGGDEKIVNLFNRQKDIS